MPDPPGAPEDGTTQIPTPRGAEVPSLSKRLETRAQNHAVMGWVIFFAAGVAGSSALIENGIKLWRFAETFLMPASSAELHGYVYEFGDKQTPVPNARIMFDFERRLRVTSNENGQFHVQFPREELGRSVHLSVRAEGYAPLDAPYLPTSLKNVDVPLSPLLNPEALGTPSLRVAPAEASTSKFLGFERFEFDYSFDPPGRRKWTRTDDGLWVESYESGKLSFFIPLEHETLDGCPGTVLAKSPISEFDEAHRTITYALTANTQQIFIPSAPCEPFWLRFRHPPESEWHWLAEIRNPR